MCLEMENNLHALVSVITRETRWQIQHSCPLCVCVGGRVGGGIEMVGGVKARNG